MHAGGAGRSALTGAAGSSHGARLDRHPQRGLPNGSSQFWGHYLACAVSTIAIEQEADLVTMDVTRKCVEISRSEHSTVEQLARCAKCPSTNHPPGAVTVNEDVHRPGRMFN